MAGTVAVYTLGCKVNQYESRALVEMLEREGVKTVSAGADACIVNTCAVTAESERKARQTVRRAIKENPGAYVLVTGCASQVSPDRFRAIPGVDYVNGNRDKKALAKKIIEYLREKEKKKGCFMPDLAALPYERMEVCASERTRAYMKVEDGCESRCAYCIIPTARGPVVSRPLEECVLEARRLAAAGYREIVLTAIELSAYGKDLKGTGVAELLEALEGVDGLLRVRFPSIDPSFLRPGFIDRAAGCKKLAHHFHLSLQSGCDETLARMRRGYNQEILRRNIAHIREVFPDVLFTADVIVGFPGETEKEYAETKAFLTELPLLHTHVFPYSRRPGTEAYTMPGQVDEGVKRARAADLIAHTGEIAAKVLKGQEGKTFEVLFETQKGGTAVGHTANFIEAAVKTREDLRGQIRTVRLLSAGNDAVSGELIKGPGEG